MWPDLDAPLSYNTAQAFSRLQSIDSALIYYRQSLHTENPLLASQAANNIGLLHVEQREYLLAASDFRQALIYDPENEIARYNYELVMKLIQPEQLPDSSQTPSTR